jgi:hypothetical protein
MRVDISFIPQAYLNNSLVKLLNKEISNPYRNLDELRANRKDLRRFYEERNNYLTLIYNLTKLEEELYQKQEISLAEKCHEYIMNLESIFKRAN